MLDLKTNIYIHFLFALLQGESQLCLHFDSVAQYNVHTSHTYVKHVEFATQFYVSTTRRAGVIILFFMICTLYIHVQYVLV